MRHLKWTQGQVISVSGGVQPRLRAVSGVQCCVLSMNVHIQRCAVCSPISVLIVSSSTMSVATRRSPHLLPSTCRAPSAEFPVTWTAPPPQPRVQPRVYCFTARQRAERAAAISTGTAVRLGHIPGSSSSQLYNCSEDNLFVVSEPFLQCSRMFARYFDFAGF